MIIKASSGINTDASNLKNCIDNLSKDINDLKNYIDYIPQYWSGNDSNDFIKKYNEVFRVLEEYEKNFYVYYNFLIKVYDIFKTLDENYNKAIDLS